MDAVAQALADPIRREILRRLRVRPAMAGEIASAFSVSRPAVSRHLRVLREAGLVQAAVCGREHEYRLQLDALTDLEAYLHDLRHAAYDWDRRFDALGTEVHRVRRRSRTGTRSDQRRNKKKEIA